MEFMLNQDYTTDVRITNIVQSELRGAGKWSSRGGTSRTLQIIPSVHEEGQVVQSLYGVTIQSFLQGSRQGLTVSGRRLSGHLEKTKGNH